MQWMRVVVSHNTTLVPCLGFCTGPACEAGLSAGMLRECVSPQIRKKIESCSGPAEWALWAFCSQDFVPGSEKSI